MDGERHAFVNVNSSSLNPIGAGNFDLHVLSGLGANEESVAHDVNDSDIAVGWATFLGEKHAVVWRIDLYDGSLPIGERIPMVDLKLLSDDSTYSEAFAINDDSPLPVIVGVGDVFDDCDCGGTSSVLVSRGFWRTLTFPAQDLTSAISLVHEALPCYPLTSAADVNTGPGGVDHETTAVGFVIDDIGVCAGDPAKLGHFWNNPDPDEGLFLNNGSFAAWQATGISDSGGIVGSVFNPGPDSAAYWPDINAAPVDIGSIVDGDGASYAQRINNRNPATEVIAVAGYHTPSADEAVLWECTGDCTIISNWSFVILDQNLINDCSDWLIRQAFDVNDDVSIICSATNTVGFDTEHAVILVPDELCCLGDLDGNGTVSTNDLLILFANWGPCPAPPVACFADLNCNGTVDTNDLIILNANWGPCGESAGGGGSSSLQLAVQQLGFPSVAAHQAWLAQASDGEAYVSTYVLITILQDQE